ncbi:hypothetical protein LEP1GSC125_3073 [Leptospira mayottensis 200901122]|uniref:Uncharacterized protein n=1 Tax=Leptospira mayottensis 200901122 TaxID=1193010 RepID=A0AA87MP99_9LEPT|nr:hypothetical protein LEP1GSC125_3073 [Leptospira mayottensis 200901122]
METPKEILNSFSILPKEIFKSRDCMLVYQNENQFRKLEYSVEVFVN